MSIKDLPCIGCDTQEGCGTGLGNWPKPGDPDNNSVLTVVPAYGGNELRWTYPGTNPNAVAYIRVLRSLEPDLDTASLLVLVSGDRHFDRIDLTDPITYYYWIQIVSVNGTHGDYIGPVGSIPLPAIEQFLQQLTGKIDNGMLAGSLKESINKIGSIEDDLSNEIFDRTTANQRLSEALDVVRKDVTASINYIDDEIIQRKEGQDALSQRIQTLVAANQDAFAAIRTEEAARVSADSALASQITTVQTTLSNDISAAIRTEETARVAADSALATQITTVQSSLGDDLASVKQTLDTDIQRIDGELVNIGARYTAQVSVNNLIGGFGIYNGGTTVEAGFDVDRFWIGRTQSNKVKPFIIEGNSVYMDQAIINKLNFSKLTDNTGNFVVENGKLKAEYIDVNKLSALSADMGVVTAGKLQSSDGKFVIDLDNKFISITV